MGTAFEILGSLGLFLFGMKLMSEGLQKLSGEKLRSVMRYMAGNRFKGVFSGCFITGVIQSSTATTVMVVSFVNAGLLTLREAIGVIMGANLGTTGTAWIIAILGFGFSLSDIALPIVGLGVILGFFRRTGCKNFGEFLVGFGLLFMGLDYLKSSVPDIQQYPHILQWITHYSNMGYLSVLLFLAFGVLLTVVMQSSTVSMAITVTMATKGWISVDLAAAIILGENIGTTLTANIAAISANINAKRAAITHLIFNILGVAWMLFVFYYFLEFIYWLVPLNPNPSPETLKSMGITDFASLQGPAKEHAMELIAIPVRMAMFHTMFNVANICLLISFVPQLEKLACWVVKYPADGKRRTPVQRLQYLSSNMAEMGELALFEGQKEMVKLAGISGEMFNGFVHIMKNPDKDLSKEVSRLRDLESDSDKLAIELTNFFVQCSSHDLSQESIKMVTRNMIVVPELEELCDQCYKLITLARKRYRKQFADKMLQSPAFLDFAAEMNKFIEFAEQSLVRQSASKEDLDKSAKMRENLNMIRKALRREAIAQMEIGGVTKGGILFIEILYACDRVNAHAMNVLEAMNLKGGYAS